MSIDQLALIAESARAEERYRRRAVDPDTAQLWIIGKFVSTGSRPGRAADNASAPSAIVGA